MVTKIIMYGKSHAMRSQFQVLRWFLCVIGVQLIDTHWRYIFFLNDSQHLKLENTGNSIHTYSFLYRNCKLYFWTQIGILTATDRKILFFYISSEIVILHCNSHEFICIMMQVVFLSTKVEDLGISSLTFMPDL